MQVRRPAAAIALAAGLVVIAGGTAGLLLTRHSTPAMHPVAAGISALPAPTGPIVGRASALASPEAAPAPVSLTIPIIGVQTRLITLGLASDGEMQVPTVVFGGGVVHRQPAAGRPRLVHHRRAHRLDPAARASSTGCRELVKGNKIYVKRADGSLAEFSVTRSRPTTKTSSRPRMSTGPSRTPSCA